jgi:SAM-dependent methyltransferase
VKAVDPSVREALVDWARAGVLAATRPALAGAFAAALREAGLPVIAIGREAARLREAGAPGGEAFASFWAEAASEEKGDRASRVDGRPSAFAPALAIVADAARLPLRDGSIGAVVDTDAFHAYPDRIAVLREWARVLAPRGVLALADSIERETDVERFFSALAGTPHMKSGEVGALVEAAGFEVEHVAIYRFTVPLAEIGADAAAAAAASDHARELYELKGDTISCRYLTLSARRSAS